MATPTRSTSRSGYRPRAPSRSLAKAGAEELATNLSGRMGDLLLTDKEASGLVIKGVDAIRVPRPL
jgi:hypothetical protein